MKYQAIIFDMDGTISDSELLWEKATDTFLLNNKIHLTKEERTDLGNKIHGTTLTNATLFLKNTFHLPKPLDQLMQEFAGYACDLMNTEVRFIDTFLEFHACLNTYNLKYGIATNADTLTLTAIKKALSLDKLFGQHIYNVDHVNQQGKPKPDIYLYAAQQLNISPYACIAIEDSACGIKAAKAADMFCIGINTHKDIDQLQDADMIINSYEDIDLSKLLYNSI